MFYDIIGLLIVLTVACIYSSIKNCFRYFHKQRIKDRGIEILVSIPKSSIYINDTKRAIRAYINDWSVKITIQDAGDHTRLLFYGKNYIINKIESAVMTRTLSECIILK
jgi:hypothetical protein